MKLGAKMNKIVLSDVKPPEDDLFLKKEVLVVRDSLFLRARAVFVGEGSVGLRYR
jgi:hypothetical protein